VTNDSFFIGKEAILDCETSLKFKNSERFDRIPKRIIRDGINHLINPLTSLFKSIYETKQIPDQWKIKVYPIPNKDSKNKITNYRRI
jgi:hypothetical protein